MLGRRQSRARPEAAWRVSAALLTHARRGNAQGAAALLRRGADRVAGYADAPPHGIDAAGICRAAREMAARIDRDGAGAAGPLTARLAAAGS